jgi:hypothetical protein
MRARLNLPPVSADNVPAHHISKRRATKKIFAFQWDKGITGRSGYQTVRFSDTPARIETGLPNLHRFGDAG